ncbi:MAG: hypothetical protein COA67_09265 [Lutibacter sp.]|nr:MAG: hypothetical protein COA67_09265 [Lutibacter sp.]
MKKIYFLIVFFLSTTVYSQTDGLSYQAVILNPETIELPGVDISGNIYPNKAIVIRFTIINDNGSNDYQETQATTTDSFGMINLFIGEGNPTGNSFNEIEWDGTPKNLKVEIDLSGGGVFTALGEQKLTFTPFAFHRNILATGNLTVDGLTTLNGDFNVSNQKPSNLSGTLNVGGLVTFVNDLVIEGETLMNSGLSVEGNSLLDGNLDVEGNTTLKGDLSIEGNTTLANLVVKGGDDIGGGSGANHIALFENTNTLNGNKADGIAIRIHGNTSNKLGYKNRFITFYGNGDYVAGRVESYDLLAGDLWESFPVPDFANLIDVFDFDNVISGGALPSLTGGVTPSVNWNDGSTPSLSIDWTDLDYDWDDGSTPSLSFYSGSFPNLNVGSFPTFDFDGFWNPTAASDAGDDIGAMIGWGMRNGTPGFLPTTPWKIALVPLILSAKQVAMNQGVIYGSKGADYAEWLEKENPEEKYMFGEVVGVKGGKISRNTSNADQVMSISLAPIVLGNMPNEDRKEDFEKVGFMGQVPVLTLGNVVIGDYIVASGYNDGYAKAVSAKDIKLKDLKSIIGKAWSGSNGNKASLINVSVGLKTNEWVEILKEQKERITEIELKLNDMNELSNRLDKLESKLEILSIN